MLPTGCAGETAGRASILRILRTGYDKRTAAASFPVRPVRY